MPPRTTLAMLACLLTLAAARWSSGPAAIAATMRAAFDDLFAFAPGPSDREALAAMEPLRIDRTGAHFLSDPDGELEHFYDSLHRAERRLPGAVAHVLHYGDSPTTGDLITADVRELLQKQFGDAGHGFVLIGQPWAWYSHRGVSVQSSGWRISPATQSTLRDGMFGIGGVSFEGSPGDTAHVALGTGGHTRLEIAYLRQPGGGLLSVTGGDQILGAIDTAGERASGFAGVPVPPGVRRLEIRVERAPVRVFGAYLTKPSSGVIYSSLGLNGGYVSVLARIFQEGHWREQLRHYRPSLVVVNYGTNESVYEKFVDFAYEKEMKEIVRRLRQALPESSILVMSPMDRGEKGEGGAIVTPPVMSRLVRMQEKVARETRCAFFNTFQAMGGAGTMAKWYTSQPRLVGADYLHPLPAGAKQIGALLFRALMDGYHRHKLRRMTGELHVEANRRDRARAGAGGGAGLAADSGPGPQDTRDQE
jgi:lysophospholipase L1-like esterase